MRKWLRFTLWTLLLLALAAGGVALWGWRAVRQTPEFYREALQVEPQRLRSESDAMLRQAAQLFSDTKNESDWEAVFTAEQVNGWLAVDLPENHPQALPPEVRDPRVAISPGGAHLGCRWETERLSTVFSIALDIYLVEPNLLAVHFKNARAGALPLPLTEVLDEVTAGAAKMDLALRWQQTEGDPVALVEIPANAQGEGKPAVRVERLELRDGAIYLAGRTLPEGETAETSRDRVATAERRALAR